MAQKRRRGSKPLYQIKIAKERIAILFEEARRRADDEELAKRYVRLARRIGMRYNVRLGGRKRLFCKNCFYYFGADTKRRLKNGHLVIICPECKRVTRQIYK